MSPKLFLISLILLQIISTSNFTYAEEDKIFGDSHEGTISESKSGKITESSFRNKYFEEKIKKLGYIEDIEVIIIKQTEFDLNKFPITVNILVKEN